MFGMSTNELGGVRTELDENHYKREAKSVEGSIYWALTEGKKVDVTMLTRFGFGLCMSQR